MARASWGQASKGDADASPFPRACVARHACVVLAACLALVRCRAQSSAKGLDLAACGPASSTAYMDGHQSANAPEVHLHWDMHSPSGNSWLSRPTSRQSAVG